MKTVLNISLIALFVSILSACGSHENKQEQVAKHCLNDSMLRVVQYDTVQSTSVKHQLMLTGKVAFDMDHTQRLFPLASGRVVHVNVSLGDFVHKGEVLATVSSSEAAENQSQLATAEGKWAIAKKNVSMAKDMFRDGLVSERDVMAAEKEAHAAETEFNKVKEQLKINNFSGVSTYTVKAPMNGYVVEKNINPDFFIRTDDNEPMFIISDISDVWVMANLYEVDLDKIKVGYEADIRTISYKDKIYHGVVDKIFNVVDPDTKTLKARIRLHNPDFMLKPEMYANVMLNYDDGNDAPVINSKSLIFDNSKNYVMVYHGPCDIEARQVEILDSYKDETYIKSGLKPGECIISRLQLLVYNEFTQN